MTKIGQPSIGQPQQAAPFQAPQPMAPMAPQGQPIQQYQQPPTQPQYEQPQPQVQQQYAPPPGHTWNGQQWVPDGSQQVAPPPPIQAPPPNLQPQYAPPIIGAPPAAFGNMMGAIDQLANKPAAGGAAALLHGTNWGNVSDGGGALLDVADANGNPIFYEGEVVKSEYKMSSNDNAMIAVEIVVCWPLTGKGRKLFDNLVFTPGSDWKVKSMARACDCLSEDGKTFIGKDEQDFVQNIVRFNVKHELYEKDNTFRNKVAGGYAAGFETPGLSAQSAPALVPQTVQQVQQPMQPMQQAPPPPIATPPNFGPPPVQ